MSPPTNSETSLWTGWPKWDDDSTFRTPNFTFTSSWSKRAPAFADGRVPIHKPRELLDCYRNMLAGRDAKAVLEVGYLHGGMVLFMADMMPTAKIVGVDINEPPTQIDDILCSHALNDRAVYCSGIKQDDGSALRNLLDREFDGRPIDLIIDDASHLYDESKTTFETCFGYLRPGGLYVIEDWGWAHWSAPQWQNPRGRFAGKVPLTELIFELIMTLASNPGSVAHVDVIGGSMALVTRGEQLAHGAPIKLDSAYLTAGRNFVGFSSDAWPSAVWNRTLSIVSERLRRKR